MDQHVPHRRHAERVGPGQRSARVVDALLHCEVDGRRAGDALDDRVGRLVGEHRDGAHHRQRGHVVEAARRRSRRPQRTDGERPAPRRCRCRRARRRAASPWRSRARDRRRRRRARPPRRRASSPCGRRWARARRRLRARRRAAPARESATRAARPPPPRRLRPSAAAAPTAAPGGPCTTIARRQRAARARSAAAGEPPSARSRRTRAPILRPRKPAATSSCCTTDGAKRGSWKNASQTLRVTAKLTSWPIRSISSNGPIRKPPASRITASIVAGSAARSVSRRSASP